MPPKHKIRVGVLGATGLLGQYYLSRLHNHPWFELVFVAASEKNVDKAYMEATMWQIPNTPPPEIPRLSHLQDIEEAKRRGCTLIFSALPSEHAERIEECWAKQCGLITNASYARLKADVPLCIAEINPESLELIKQQQRQRGWRGFIVAKPNCTVQAVMLPLAPLHRAFRLKKLQITTMQAISGAGLQGLFSHEIHDNIIPHIPGEEEKLQTEPLKIWQTEDLTISAQCNRVAVLHGHMSSLCCTFEKKPTHDEIRALWHKQCDPLLADLPTAAKKPIHFFEDQPRPQNRLDLMTEAGMGVAVGRLCFSALFDMRFVALCHNAIRGGAGGAILTAELLHKLGYV